MVAIPVKLVLGVADVPYSQALSAQAARTMRWRLGKRPWQRLAGTQTTGDVAQILEARYAIMENFWEMHGEAIADSLAEVMRGNLENLMMGAPLPDRLFAEGDLSRIEEMFREMLDRQELDGRVAGVPTDAARRGVNPRLMHPYAKDNPERPSFIASGLYQSSMRAWVEE